MANAAPAAAAPAAAAPVAAAPVAVAKREVPASIAGKSSRILSLKSHPDGQLRAPGVGGRRPRGLPDQGVPPQASRPRFRERDIRLFSCTVI